MMSPIEIYKKRVRNFGFQADRLQKLANRLSMARLIIFISGFVLLASLSSFSKPAALTAFGLSLFAFIWLVFYHDKTEKKRIYFSHLKTINELEQKSLEGDFSAFTDGSQYAERDHPYSYDLDIFGKASLFQYICRTTSRPASDLLAEYLKSPASTEEIQLRQEAITELKPLTDWRQNLMTLGYSISRAGNDPQKILQWFSSENLFPKRKILRITTGILTAQAITVIILVIRGLPAALLAPSLILNFIYYFSHSKNITKLQQQVGESSDLLKAYSSTIRMIETEEFTSTKLKFLRSVFTKGILTSELIRDLSGLVSKLDRRMNVLVSVPLNLIFFNDIHYCLALEKWKVSHSNNVPSWFSSMAEFEVIASFANMAFNNPDWTNPEVVPEFFTLKAASMGHPLIPASRRINNYLITEGKGKTILITGSNMSGKSTFLRTCGVNTILALAGAPVCAQSFTVSQVQVFSSMRISDSLEDNISSFYAELRRLHSIITEAEKNPKALLLLDEILRGTNSNDRFTGSVALIRQLSGYGTVSIVATHDLKLTELSEEMPGLIDNYHFDVKVSGEELFFDYKLTPGICTSLNASILMKKMGIKV